MHVLVLRDRMHACVVSVPFSKLPRSCMIVVALLLCRELVKEDIQAIQPFKGKRIFGALYGLQVTTDKTDYFKMMYVCKQEGFRIFLPNGKELSAGNACIVSNGPATSLGAATSRSAIRHITHAHAKRHLEFSLQSPYCTRMMPRMTSRMASVLLRKVPTFCHVPMAARTCRGFFRDGVAQLG